MTVSYIEFSLVSLWLSAEDIMVASMNFSSLQFGTWNETMCCDINRYLCTMCTICRWAGMDTHPYMRELGLVVVCAVEVDTRYLGDVGDNSDPELDRPKLENKETHLLVPRLAVSWWLLGSPRRNLQITEVRLSLVAVRADELEHQEKEVANC